MCRCWRSGGRPGARSTRDRPTVVREERGERRARARARARRAAAAPASDSPSSSSASGPSTSVSAWPIGRYSSVVAAVAAEQQHQALAERPRRAELERHLARGQRVGVINPITASALASRCLSAARLSSPPSGTCPGSELPLTSAPSSIGLEELRDAMAELRIRSRVTDEDTSAHGALVSDATFACGAARAATCAR